MTTLLWAEALLALILLCPVSVLMLAKIFQLEKSATVRQLHIPAAVLPYGRDDVAFDILMKTARIYTQASLARPKEYWSHQSLSPIEWVA